MPRLDIDASRFWSLETRLNGDSEVSCAPESDPLVDFDLRFFTVGDNVEYPPGATTGDARLNMGGPGNVQGAVRTCSDRRSRLIVTVCAR